MILNKEQDIVFMKKTAETIFSAVILSDYGENGLKSLLQITDAASNLYKYIPLDENYEVVFYKPLYSSNSLSALFPFDYLVVTDFSSFASNTSKQFVIEIIDETTIHVLIDKSITISSFIDNSVVYRFFKGKEIVFGKAIQTTLNKAPGVVSYFATPTFKHLDDALEHYKIFVARRSKCDTMNKAWFDPSNRILLKGGTPEEHLKKSLYSFLSHYVRGEVKEEQNVDDSKPVDIKISFDFSSHIALIEVKWLGKSINALGQKRPNQTMTDAVAVAGANQLANYLELHKPNSVSKVTKGYLVVFDARRWGTNTNTTSISKKNGMYYENHNIVFIPSHHTIRDDFAMPVRFFIEPDNMTP
ncbi:MAG: hypothetical protein ACM3U1_04350 [Chloroflexota bacterium]